MRKSHFSYELNTPKTSTIPIPEKDPPKITKEFLKNCEILGRTYFQEFEKIPTEGSHKFKRLHKLGKENPFSKLFSNNRAMMKTETSVNASKRINIYSQASIDESTNSTNHRTINDHSQKPYNENYSEDGFIPIFRTSKLQRCLSETDPSKKEIIESYFENKISRKPQQLDYPTFTGNIIIINSQVRS